MLRHAVPNAYCPPVDARAMRPQIPQPPKGEARSMGGEFRISRVERNVKRSHVSSEWPKHAKDHQLKRLRECTAGS